MKTVLAILVAAVASATAFHVAVPANRVSATRPSTTTCSAGYVPDGLSEKEWDKIKKEKADEQAKNKKYYKEKKYESLDSFMKGMEKGRKHAFAKVDESKQKLGPAGSRGVKQGQ